MAQGVAERVGIQDIYDPGTDAVVEAKVTELLSNGLTVDEAVRVALLNNRGFQALFHAIGASRADVVQSGLLRNPTLALSLAFPEGGGRSKLNLGFAQQLVDLWQIPVRKRIAQAELEQTILAVLQRAVELTAEVRARCNDVLSLLQAERITKENLALAERSLEVAQVRFSAGEVSPVDVNLARADVLAVKGRVITLRQERQVADTVLAESLGLTRWAEACTLADGLSGRSVAGSNEETLMSIALDHRYDVQITAARVDAAEHELERQVLNVFPSVMVGFDAERGDRRALPGRKPLADTARASIAAGQLSAPTLQSKSERALQRRQIIDWVLGPSVQLTLPIWDQNRAQIAKARYEVLRHRSEYEALLDGVAREVRQASVTERAAAELVRFYEDEALPQSHVNLDDARRLYEDGQENILVLIGAQRSLIQQRLAHVEALRAHALAVSELERAVGGQLPDSATTQPALYNASSDRDSRFAASAVRGSQPSSVFPATCGRPGNSRTGASESCQ